MNIRHYTLRKKCMRVTLNNCQMSSASYTNMIIFCNDNTLIITPNINYNTTMYIKTYFLEQLHVKGIFTGIQRTTHLDITDDN